MSFLNTIIINPENVPARYREGWGLDVGSAGRLLESIFIRKRDPVVLLGVLWFDFPQTRIALRNYARASAAQLESLRETGKRAKVINLMIDQTNQFSERIHTNEDAEGFSALVNTHNHTIATLRMTDKPLDEDPFYAQIDLLRHHLS